MTDNKNRQQDVTRTVVVGLKEVQGKIPRNTNGDPAFTKLQWGDEEDDNIPLYCFDHKCREEGENWLETHHNCNTGNDPTIPLNVLEVFTEQQVVAIVNRWLYQAEYQQASHVKRAARQREAERPVKEAFKKLFPGVSYINATPEQIKAAAQEAYKEVKSE